MRCSCVLSSSRIVFDLELTIKKKKCRQKPYMPCGKGLLNVNCVFQAVCIEHNNCCGRIRINAFLKFNIDTKKSQWKLI